MRNYLSIGPVRIRTSTQGIAPWGYAMLEIGGLSFFGQASNGSMTLASYHPRASGTWYWAVYLGKRSGSNHCWVSRSTTRRGQWHDYYRLPFNREIIVSRQDYHRRLVAPPSPQETAGE